MLRSCTRFIDKHKLQKKWLGEEKEEKYPCGNQIFILCWSNSINESILNFPFFNIYLSIYQSTYAKKKNTLVSGNAGYEKIFTRECTTLYFSINLIGFFNSTFLFYLLLFEEKKRHFLRINLLGENRLNSKF